MREFRLVFAQHDSDGKSRMEVASRIATRFLESFGGYTWTEGHGGFIMSDEEVAQEPVHVFDVAAKQRPDVLLLYMRVLAAEICHDMGQESVYFRNVDGEVHFLS